MFEIELGGFDDLQKQVKEAQKAAEALDGDVCSVRFDPKNSADVQRAVREMEQAVDAKVAPFRNNPFIAPLIEESKNKFRDEILKRAQEAREQE